MKPRISHAIRNTSANSVAKVTGYTRTHVRRVFDGLNTPSLESGAAIAEAMHITLDELYWHREAMKLARQNEALRDAGKLTKMQMLRQGKMQRADI